MAKNRKPTYRAQFDGHKRLADMGVDECCDMPWLYYGAKFKSPIEEKIEHMKRFTDEVIAKM